VEFAPSARRHQAEDHFEDADILHAIEHALYVGDDGDDPDKALYWDPIGPPASWKSWSLSERTTARW
jgi:hypothetical protein